MTHILIQQFSLLTKLSEVEKQAIQESAPIKTFSKDTYLLREGQIAQDSFFVIKGCIREYELIDGEEKTTTFFTENQPAANFYSLANQVPFKQNFICAEKTTVAILNDKKEKELYREFPRFETFCCEGMEKMMGKKQNQLSEFITLKPEQRYLKLQNERPDLINRIPQYQIASYLGVKPETLSRIRKRLGNG